jgi:hypothetical protein
MADMSAAAVTARLKRAAELASLCIKLSRTTAESTEATPGRLSGLPRQGADGAPGARGEK